MISKEKFRDLVLSTGSRETSATPDQWVEDNSTLGHCAVVALLAQDIFGGEILRASLENTEFAYGKSHYWNLLPDGTEVDFTESQFEGRKPVLTGEFRTRAHILTNKQTEIRYLLLKERFTSHLKQLDDIY